ncbi:unnamed protein product, partial [Ectocarpus sp. 4 AP-2014]
WWWQVGGRQKNAAELRRPDHRPARRGLPAVHLREHLGSEGGHAHVRQPHPQHWSHRQLLERANRRTGGGREWPTYLVLLAADLPRHGAHPGNSDSIRRRMDGRVLLSHHLHATAYGVAGTHVQGEVADDGCSRLRVPTLRAEVGGDVAREPDGTTPGPEA